MKSIELLEQKEQEHKNLRFKSFTNKEALEIGLRFVKIAEERKLPITIDICRNSQQLFHYACEGTSADNDCWIKRKNRVVNHFGKSSFYIRTLLKDMGQTLEDGFFLNSKEYSAFGGSFPIIIEDVGAVGTITVSGLTEEEDHGLVVSVIKEFV